MHDLTPPPPQGLDGKAEEHLHRLMAGWQLIADLSFADLLLFVPAGAESFRIAGQMRPYTARTLYPADLVGEVVEPGWHPFVERAWREERRLLAPPGGSRPPTCRGPTRCSRWSPAAPIRSSRPTT